LTFEFGVGICAYLYVLLLARMVRGCDMAFGIGYQAFVRIDELKKEQCNG